MIDDRMTEEKLADSEILERLIYKAFVSPDKFLPHDTGDALLTFAMAMRLYHRICALENCTPVIMELPQTDRQTDRQTDSTGTTEGEGKEPAAFAGKGSGEKREIYEHLTAFIARHGSGARGKIARCSDGALSHDDLLSMSECKSLPLSKWRVAEAAMVHIEQEEIANAP